VVAARSLNRGDQVAIKLLLPDKAQQEDVVGRFLLEAAAVLKIESPHVARIFDVGKLDDGSPYMVMEYLDGQSLASVVRTGQAIAVETAVGWVLQACEAIAEAHAAGIVHRDLKPENLFLTNGEDGKPTIKVLDFGVSKMRDAGRSLGQTAPTEMLGSPFYMAPEQMRCSRDVDVRADIWALGVTLYELLSGKRPFIADNLPSLMIRVLTTQPSPLGVLRPGVATELEAVVQKCLEKEPDRRYAGVAELATALAPFGPAEARLSLDRISRISQAAAAPAPTQLTGASEPPPRRRFPMSVLVGLSAVIALALVGAALIAR